MNRFLIALALLATFACASESRDATPLPPAPTNGYCYDSFTAPNYSGVRECSVTPPFNPPNDPNALNNISGRFASHTCGFFATNDGQIFSSLFGRGEGVGATVITTWPYRPSTSVSISLPPHSRYLGGVGQMPTNPGVSRHSLKGDPYGGSCGLRTSPGARVDVRVVPVGTTPAFAGICSKPAVPFDGGPWVTINPSGFNSTMCNVPPNALWRYIVENTGNTTITVILTWN